MTYLAFHLRFNLPALAILAVLAGPWTWEAARWGAAMAVAGVAFVFTTPWDNAAVARGIWGFPSGRFWRQVGWLPVEEYAFFVIQTAEVVLLVEALRRLGWPAAVDVPVAWPGPEVAVGLPSLLLAWVGLGRWQRRRRPPEARSSWRWHYAWHLLYWFVPVVAVQWVVGWQVLAPRAGLVAVVTGLAGSALTLADLAAVRAGTWHFDARQITGWRWRGVLPWEEGAFFYLTSLVVAQSHLLLLPADLR